MRLPQNIALIHDWLVSMRGGEKVLEVLCDLLPDATLFTLVHSTGQLSPSIDGMNIKTSFLQYLPFAKRHYQYFLPLYPVAVEQFNLDEFDLIISSSHAAAKGVRVRENALHICYCHTPMRYIWDQFEQYFGVGRASVFTRSAMKVFLNYLRRWDVETANGVHHFIANSINVQKRIKRVYNRDAEVIYPPVDVQRFPLSKEDQDYYLIVSALVPYKRIDLAVEAFNYLGERLLIVGIGGEEARLESQAGKNIEFLGWVGEGELMKYYAGCRALIFPGEEDFGIAPVEAMACGKPILAYGKGGALETVVEGKTGMFFQDPSAESLILAFRKLEKHSFNPIEIRRHAEQFGCKIFRERINKYINQKWSGFLSRRSPHA